MKYYSDVTKEMYDTIDDLNLAENAVKKSEDDIEKAKQEYEEALDVAVKYVVEAYKKFGRYMDLGGKPEMEEHEDIGLGFIINQFLGA